MSDLLRLRSLLLMGITLICCNCSDNAVLKESLEEAGNNSTEISAFLDQYSDKRRDAARYLVQSMIGMYGTGGNGLDSIEMLYKELPQKNGSWQFNTSQLVNGQRYMEMPITKTKDLQVISADYLIRNMDDAWHTMKSRKWNTGLSVADFSELLLPYRSGNEKITEWRTVYRETLDSLNEEINHSTNSIDAARIVAKALGEIHYNNKIKTPHRPATGILEAPVGYCREDCDRNLFAMRALGIPVTIDEILASPDNGAPHQWNVVYDNIDKIYRMFDNVKYLPTRDSLHYDGRRKGKVFRRTLNLNLDRLEKFRFTENPPSVLLNPHHKDVTSEYFGHNKAQIIVDKNVGDVYLGLFSPEGYRPIDIGERKEEYVIFKDIEPQLIYFPITREGGGFRTCGMPFLLKYDGTIHYFKPTNNKKEITLIRKMPFWLHHEKRMSSIIGCTIQVGQTSTGPWKDIQSIREMPSHSHLRIPVSLDAGVRFIRILPSPTRQSQIGEVIASVDSLALKRLTLSVITDNMTEGKKKLVDGNVLTWTNYKKGYRELIFKIESSEYVNSIFLIPRNDDNYVVPGEEYELYYFENGDWKSLGKKIASDFNLKYRVPDNAVFWLRNYTKGKEEQIFIRKHDRQAFNADLPSYSD